MAKDMKVLIVDDDDVLLDLMMRRLQRMGLTADRAENGAEGLNRIAENHYDLVVTDIYMPKSTGLDLLEAVKKKDPKTQVIAITGGATIEMALEALEKGAFAYLTKPFDHLKVFDHTVKQALRHRHMMLNGSEPRDSLQDRQDAPREQPPEAASTSSQTTESLLKALYYVGDAIMVVDKRGNVVLANPNAERLIGEGWDVKSLDPSKFKAAMESSNGHGATININGVEYRIKIVELDSGSESTNMLFIMQPKPVQDEGLSGQERKSLEVLKSGLGWLYRQKLREKEEFRILLKLANEIASLEKMQGMNPDGPDGLQALLEVEDSVNEEVSRVLVDGPQ
jgi:CheY-like chemotaxis protein